MSLSGYTVFCLTVTTYFSFSFSLLFQERLESIERDQREYTLDEDDKKVQDAILDRDPSRNHTVVLKKSLSCSYPHLPFDEALQKENEKLHLELQRSQARMDLGQCEVIQHLIDVTQTVACTLQEKSTQLKNPKNVEPDYSDANNDKECAFDRSYHKEYIDTKTTSRLASSFIFSSISEDKVRCNMSKHLAIIYRFMMPPAFFFFF